MSRSKLINCCRQVVRSDNEPLKLRVESILQMAMVTIDSLSCSFSAAIPTNVGMALVDDAEKAYAPGLEATNGVTIDGQDIVASVDNKVPSTVQPIVSDNTSNVPDTDMHNDGEGAFKDERIEEHTRAVQEGQAESSPVATGVAGESDSEDDDDDDEGMLAVIG